MQSKNIKLKFSKLEQTVTSGKAGTDDLMARLEEMEENIGELSALYQDASDIVNPFLHNTESPATEKLSAIEKKIEDMSAKTTEASINLTTDFDNKFKEIESDMGRLKKIIESVAVNKDAMVERISGRVLEHAKPATRTQKTVFSPVAIPQQTKRSEDRDIKLAALDDKPETSVILLNWIQFLMEKGGRNNLIDILEYYIEIGWISESVSSIMIDYANGIDYYVERLTWKLLPEDHIKSLMFIEQIRGRKIDKYLISRLERDIDKIIRSNEIMIK